MQSQTVLSLILQLREHIYSRCSLMLVAEGRRMQNQTLLSRIHLLAERKSLSLVVVVVGIVVLVVRRQRL
jgi:hypothetical protein